jgi:phage/plasmid-like protein (TIGR03299 family)
MSHEIENMLYVGATPWHSLGVKLDAPPTAAEAIKLAGLDWSVGLKSLATLDGESVDHKATYRLSDGRILGVVGPAYHPIQNSEAFDWFNPFLESGEASIETAGSLRDGQRVWVLAKLNRAPSVIVPGDEVQKFILLANSHDGTFAGRVGFTPIRVVCANTLSMATEEGVSQLLRVRHTKGAKKALDKIREIMNLANASFEATAAQYRQLAAHQVEPGDLEKYVKLVFKPVQTAKEKAHEAAIANMGAVDATGDNTLASLLADKPVADHSPDADEAKRERSSRVLESITELFEAGRGNNLPGVAGSWWAAYNAVTEYTTHHRGRSEESRLQSMFSDGAAINRRALSTATALALV